MSKGCSRFWVFRGIPSRVGHRCLFAGEKKWRVCFGRGEVPKVPIRESVRVSHPAMMITILQRKGFCSDWVFAAFDRCLLHFACLLCNGEDDGVIASMTPPPPRCPLALRSAPRSGLHDGCPAPRAGAGPRMHCCGRVNGGRRRRHRGPRQARVGGAPLVGFG